MIDLKKLAAVESKDIINPERIFSSLPSKNEKYKGYLRNVQSEVLNKWFEIRNNKENIIKMNTGSGKTTVSLLILQSCLNEKKGNAIYVVPDKYLVKQVVEEANDLGIKITDNEEDIDFKKNASILVITIQKLINGKSVFKRKNIDCILIDDVHACLETSINQFKVLVERRQNGKMYNDIINLFSNELQQQNYNNYLNISEGISSSNPMMVPFWGIQEKYKELIKIINNNIIADNTKDIEFSMGLIGDIIEFCNVVVTHNCIEITPDCIPIQKICGFDNAKRRIYVSATLKDDGDLLKSFNIEENKISKIITPEYASDIGNRIILYPQINNPKITDEEIKLYLKEESQKNRIIVIVPSAKRAEFWKDKCDRIFDKNNIDDIRKYNRGLDIVINRYNGIDLKDETCRILVIDGLPDAKTKYEEIKERMLFRTNNSQKDKIQKIEQGMGRGVRSTEDYCAIVLMGKDLSNIIYENDSSEFFSTSTLKQFKLSEELHSELKEKTVNDILDNIRLCTEKNEEWYSIMNRYMNELKYEDMLNYDIIELNQNKAYQAALNGNYSDCLKIIQDNINAETNSRIKGYYKMQLAKYTNLIDKEEAQNILKSAMKDNNYVLKPINGYTPTIKTGKIKNQAQQLKKYIKEKYNSTKKYFMKLNSIVLGLVFAPETHTKFEESICELADNIGFIGSMPEREFDKGPDDFWQIDNNNFVVIECKNEAISPGISKSDSSQLADSYEWAKKNYPNAKKIKSVIIHKDCYFDSKANPKDDVCIFSKAEVDKLNDNLTKFASAIEKYDINDLTEEIIEQKLKQYKLTYDDFCKEYFKRPKTINEKNKIYN